MGDFDGDGKLDIVTANNNAGTLSFFRNLGNGAFAPKIDFLTGSSPRALVSGDFNGDGKLDLADGSYSSASTVNILLGNGNGTFGNRTDYVCGAQGSTPAGIATGDFNRDGKLDIASANFTNTVGTLLNRTPDPRVSGTLTFEGVSASAVAQPVIFTFRSPGFADFAPMLNVTPAGNFAFNLPKRSGVLHIKGANSLAANVSVDVTAGDVSGVTAFLPAGDANNDNSVDTSDFGVLVGAYNGDIAIPGSGYDETADFNGDGVVDTSDFGLLVGEYNNVGDL